MRVGLQVFCSHDRKIVQIQVKAQQSHFLLKRRGSHGRGRVINLDLTVFGDWRGYSAEAESGLLIKNRKLVLAKENENNLSQKTKVINKPNSPLIQSQGHFLLRSYRVFSAVSIVMFSIFDGLFLRIYLYTDCQLNPVALGISVAPLVSNNSCMVLLISSIVCSYLNINQSSTKNTIQPIKAFQSNLCLYALNFFIVVFWSYKMKGLLPSPFYAPLKSF